MTKIQSLDQLLDVAGRRFGESGYEGTRLEDIADELGVLKGSLYHYISSKAELHFLVTRRRLLGQMEKIRKVVESEFDSVTKLNQAIRSHLSQFDEFYPESTEWFANPYDRTTEYDQARVDLSREYEHTFRQIIRQGVQEGVFRRDVDVAIASISILGMCNWTARWYVKDGRLSIDQISDTLVLIVVDGLTSGPKKRAPKVTASAPKSQTSPKSTARTIGGGRGRAGRGANSDGAATPDAAPRKPRASRGRADA